MNLKYEWINTLFIILPLSLCVFIIVDIAYNERIWELDTFAVKARLQALGITVAYFYLLNYIFKRVARFFIDKSKDEKKANWKEYVWVFLINFVFLNKMCIRDRCRSIPRFEESTERSWPQHCRRR